MAAVDIGGTKVTVSISDKTAILVKVYQPVKLEGDHKTIPRQVDFLIGYACEKIGIKKNDISALGISTCSPFKKIDDYCVIVTGNLCGGLAKERKLVPNDWTEIPIEEELSKTYKNLKIGNDCVTAVVAERLFGAGKGEDNLVYVTWSTGIGSGAYVDGNLIVGKDGNAPHFGHITLKDDGPMCACGGKGHLEALSSGVAIARDYGGATGEVFSAYEKGDEKAKKVIENAAKYFGIGLATINIILDTKVFVIGGGVFMNHKDILFPLIKKEFNKSFKPLSEGVELRPSALDKFLGDIAALSLVMPDSWIKEWQDKKPWENAPEPIILGI